MQEKVRWPSSPTSGFEEITSRKKGILGKGSIRRSRKILSGPLPIEKITKNQVQPIPSTLKVQGRTVRLSPSTHTLLYVKSKKSEIFAVCLHLPVSKREV
jgi:hypothetical protein